MTEANASAPVAARFQLPMLGYLLLAVAFAFGLHALFIAGPAMRVAAHDRIEQVIAAEDRSVCEALGARAGTDAFTACSRALAVVRQNQVERDNAAAQGML